MRKFMGVAIVLFLVVGAGAFAGGGAETGRAQTDRVLPNMTGTRVVDQPITLTAIVNLSEFQNDANTLEFIKDIQELTGVYWDFENVIGGTEYEQKLNLTFASGDLPDVIYDGGPQRVIIEQSSVGNIIPLNDLIDQYTVNIRRHLSEREDIRRMVTLPDGNIYSLWALEELESRNWVDPFLVNQKWLDNLGLDVPTDIYEFRDVLRAFKTQDANGSGDPNDEIPFTWREQGWSGQRIDTMFGAWGVMDRKDDNHVAFENGKAFLTAIDPRFREGLEYFHGLYAEGLIDPEVFTQSVAQLRAKASADLVGSLVFFWPTNVFGDQRVQDLTFAGVLAGPDGTRMASFDQPISGWLGYKYFLTRANRYPEVSIRYADILMDDGEMSLNAAYGREGHFWVSVEGGRWTLDSSLIPSGLGEVQHRDAVTLKNQIAHRSQNGLNARRVPDAVVAVRDEWYQQIKQYIVTPPPPLPAFWFSVAESAELTRLAAEVTAYAEEMRARFILEGITDASWNQYVRNMERIGYRRMLEIYQTAYDSFYAN